MYIEETEHIDKYIERVCVMTRQEMDNIIRKIPQWVGSDIEKIYFEDNAPTRHFFVVRVDPNSDQA